MLDDEDFDDELPAALANKRAKPQQQVADSIAVVMIRTSWVALPMNNNNAISVETGLPLQTYEMSDC